MATIRRFEAIAAWQRARELTRQVNAASRSGAFARDFARRDQLPSAAISMMSNIAEGFGRDGNADSVQCLSVARGSAAEVQPQLYIALDQEYVSGGRFGGLHPLADEESPLIAGLIAQEPGLRTPDSTSRTRD